MMKRYGMMLRGFLGDKQEGEQAKPKKQKSSILAKLAVILVILSFILYGMIAVVPFLPLSLAQKAVLIPALVVSGEITWWVGVAIVGKQVVSKYRKYLNPCTWFSCKKNTKVVSQDHNR